MSPRLCAWVGAAALTMLASPSVRAQTMSTAVRAMDVPYDVGAGAEAPAASLASSWREQIARLELGYRGVFVNSVGYDPFSTNRYLPAFSLVATRTLVTSRDVAFASGIAWDYGGSSAVSRGDPMSLHVQRLTVPLEGRFYFGRWGYALGRIAPGAAMERAQVNDASAPSALTKSLWLFTGDVSAGYAFPLLPLPPRPGRALRAWLQGDVGYTWTPDNRLMLASSGPQTTDAVDLGSLGMRGAFLRLAVAVSY